MTPTNPYDAPKTATGGNSSHATLLWTTLTVFGCTLLGGAIGLGVGVTLGSRVPGYYRAVFSSGNDPGFDPIAVGIGQGLTQGLVFGGVIGLVLVAMFSWQRSQRAR